MNKIGVFLAEGCEEIEALTVVDVVRRAGIEVAMISVSGEKQVRGAHDITFLTDIPAEFMDYDMLDGIVLPGGMPGTLNLGANETVQKIIRTFAEKGKMVAAICAAPSVLGEAGLLEGKKATCYPGFEDTMLGADYTAEKVTREGNIFTACGPGAAWDLGFAFVEQFCGIEKANELRTGMQF